jgi:hypothetical protein
VSSYESTVCLKQEWDTGIKIATEELGISGGSPHCGAVFLNAA